ncbi:hypothetical protein [Neobacillus citreus]|uniref:DUF697 domain-containing protein n=1 Tax=Neobacillus citreus TaxID=2833578 RepID=A0A9J6MXP0_9BACI|nr:hypothetical protein [Neobacillus citreus]MCH6269360.1 hypothetical protein [Neobacillus citreus]
MIPNTLSELNRIKEECKTMVNKRASASAAAAVVPVPGADVGADVVIMMELLPAINRKFGLSPEQLDQLDSVIKGKIAVIISSIGSELVGKYITKQTITMLLKKVGAKVAVKQVAKYVPFIGQAVSAGISFGAMKYLGNSHIDECYEVCRRVIEMREAESATKATAQNSASSEIKYEFIDCLSCGTKNRIPLDRFLSANKESIKCGKCKSPLRATVSIN